MSGAGEGAWIDVNDDADTAQVLLMPGLDPATTVFKQRKLMPAISGECTPPSDGYALACPLTRG